MKRNGFTLIELLAVIVILAIIALIATPIILGIINTAREKSNERSVELYASAVRNAMAAYQLTGLNVPTSFSDLTIQYDGDVVCSVKELYEDGSFYLEGCKVNNGEKEYSYGTKQEKEAKLNDVCDPVNVETEGAYIAGDKYTCTVDPNKPAYTFYVLNTPASGADSVNLIMDSNINISGEAVKEGVTDKGLVAWITIDDYTSEEIGGTQVEWNVECSVNERVECGNWNKGPISAMNHLQTATAGWTNVNQQIISTFTDENGNTHNMAKTYIVNARMPYLSEVSNYDENNAYLYDYMSNAGVNGYWILSSNANAEPSSVWSVISDGDVYNSSAGSIYFLDDDSNIGVRPVINLSI